MRRATIALITLALLFGTRLHAQNIMDVKHVIEKSFNYGAKLGINASFPVIHELSINDVDAENMLIDYQVGWEATLFCRFNLNRFFLQPNVTWSKTSAQMRFLIPDQPEQVDLSGQTNTILRIDTRNLYIPVLLGYNLVRQDPYGLSLMAGPKFRYRYKADLSYEDEVTVDEFSSNNSPFGISITTAIGVNIGRLFFDFMYDFGLNQSESEIRTFDANIPNASRSIRLDRRVNEMSISLGFLF